MEDKAPKGLNFAAFIWFCIACALGGALVEEFTTADANAAMQYQVGYTAGISAGRVLEGQYESGVMKAGGLCSYAELACTRDTKEKKHGRHR